MRRRRRPPTRSIHRRAPQSATDRRFRRNRRTPVQSPSSAFGCSGASISRDVNVGDVVKKGQRLATLDPSPTSWRCGRRSADLASATARLENAAATEIRQRTLLQQNITTQAQFEAGRAGPRVRGGQRHARQGKPRQGRGAARLHRASRRLRRGGHRHRGGARAGGPAGADRRHGGPPGHPRGGRRPAREHRAGSQAGSPLRHRPASRSLGAGCRVGAGDRSAGGSRHPHAAGAGSLSTTHRRASASARRSPHGHEQARPQSSSCRSRPCWSATAGRWSGWSTRRHRTVSDRARDGCRSGRVFRPGRRTGSTPGTRVVTAGVHSLTPKAKRSGSQTRSAQ